jgi:hypothetical protein
MNELVIHFFTALNILPNPRGSTAHGVDFQKG